MKRRRTKPSTEAVTVPVEPLMAIRPSAVTQAFFPFLFDDEEEETEEPSGPVAVVCIDGPLMQRGGWFFDGYDDVLASFRDAITNPETKAVVLRINSPGGTVAGMFGAARDMLALKAFTGKPVYAFADELAASAGYALAVVADEIWLPASGEVGSIGVLATAVDETKLNEKMGVRIAVMQSGAQKTDGHPDVPLTPETIARMQSQVNYLAGLFFEHVAANRSGLTVETIRAMEAGVFYGPDAVTAGLADRVGSYPDLLAAAAARIATQPEPMPGHAAARPSTAQGTRMKTLLAALGLSDTATEADALAALSPVANIHNQLASLTGKSAPAEALAVVQAWRSSHEQVPVLQARIADGEKAAEKAELTALIERGRTEGQLTAAMATSWAPTQTPAALRAYLEVAPKVIPGPAAPAVEGKDQPAAATLSLSAEDKLVAKQLGLSEADMLASKQAVKGVAL